LPEWDFNPLEITDFPRRTWPATTQKQRLTSLEYFGQQYSTKGMFIMTLDKLAEPPDASTFSQEHPVDLKHVSNFAATSGKF
jgi:hypothetical protein